jgi:hypothetical protein
MAALSARSFVGCTRTFQAQRTARRVANVKVAADARPVWLPGTYTAGLEG